MVEQVRIVVIGAGLAGLRLAADLATAGHAPVVVDKSRGLGGRLATRRGPAGSFDHGAQYIAARGSTLAAYLARAEQAGAAGLWTLPEGRQVHVGLPGMSGVVRPLAVGLDIRGGVEIAAVTACGDGWRLTDGTGEALLACDRLAIAIPAPQAARLLGQHPLAADLSAVTFDPCWTLMAAFESPPDLPTARRDPSGTLGWVARNADKPGRTDETWVVQAGAAWSRAHLELDRQEAAQRLLEELSGMAGTLPATTHLAAHRWRYAQAARPLGAPCLACARSGLVIAGDWCLGPRAEQAWDSGGAAAAALAAML